MQSHAESLKAVFPNLGRNVRSVLAAMELVLPENDTDLLPDLRRQYRSAGAPE